MSHAPPVPQAMRIEMAAKRILKETYHMNMGSRFDVEVAAGLRVLRTVFECADTDKCQVG